MNILDVIATQRKGRCMTDAQAKLQELVKACASTGKSGKLILTLEVSAAEDSTVVIKDDVTIKQPKPATGSTIFYADEQGDLHREDPRQPEFPEVAKIENAVNQ